MKRILLFLLVISLTGCQKMVMHDQETQIANINSIKELNTALIGVYSALSEYMNNDLGQVIPQEFADDFSLVPYINHYYHTHAYKYGADLTVENKCWEELYKIAACANNIICQFEKRKSIKREFRAGWGEAYLIRAYAYFRLVRIFGEVPIIKDLDVNYTVSKSTFRDIYAFIESDLIHAISLLPDNRGTARYISVPHRGSAKAILAEVYLTMGGYPLNDLSKYAQAAEMAKEVMDSASFFGFNLVPDYADLWNGKQKINNETILGLYYTTLGKYDNWGFDNELNNITPYIGMYADHTPYIDWSEYVSPYLLANIKFYNNYPGSYRRDATFQSILPNLPYNPPNLTVHPYPTIFKNYRIADNSIPIFYKKFGYYCSADTSTVLYNLGNPVTTGTPPYDTTIFNIYFHRILDQPIYIFRYAHTLLTYAEAKARSGQLDASAYGAINMIRRRANKVEENSASIYDLNPGLTADQFADSIVRERELELCGELEGRWFDLVRLNMVSQLPALRGGGPSTNSFANIPANELILNPNLK